MLMMDSECGTSSAELSGFNPPTERRDTEVRKETKKPKTAFQRWYGQWRADRGRYVKQDEA